MKKSKTLAVLAYICWIPALYIVLTGLRKDEFVGFHGGQALIVWTLIFAGFFGLRFAVNLVWLLFYIPYLDLLEVLFAFGAWGYAVSCGLRCAQGEMFTIPN
jgi:uncharacterized membrane protein